MQEIYDVKGYFKYEGRNYEPGQVITTGIDEEVKARLLECERIELREQPAPAPAPAPSDPQTLPPAAPAPAPAPQVAPQPQVAPAPQAQQPPAPVQPQAAVPGQPTPEQVAAEAAAFDGR